MRQLITIISAVAVSLSTAPPLYSSQLEYVSAASHQIRWPNKTITIALSSSLKHPGSNFKLGSDVVRTAYRALSRWSTVADISFVITDSPIQSVSRGAGDGISLITIADTPQNNALFNGEFTTGKTRIFYDEDTGSISEADIVINPHPTSAEGHPVQFATDGTPGTYDLESTFTHEIGHLLGLDHSPVIAATMHESQGLNGLYGRPAFTQRTLSEEDRARVRSIYSTEWPSGVIEGVIQKLSSNGKRAPLGRTEVWVEDNVTGRVIASTLTSGTGNYRISSLPPSTYRVLTRHLVLPELSEEIAANLDNGFRDVQLNASEVKTFDLVPHKSNIAILNPRLIGTDGELSNKPIPAEAGNRVRVYVAGEGVDQVSETGISITSPYFVVEPGTLRTESFRTFYPVISFEVKVAAQVPFGDYTIRLRSALNEVAYVAGAISIDPAVESDFPNPTDDALFYVKQQYRDLLGREADATGLEYWIQQIDQCGEDAACRRTRRLSVSVSLLSGTEFSNGGALIHRLYRIALGRSPRFAEFQENANHLLATRAEALTRLVLELVKLEEFGMRYPRDLTGEQFVDLLLKNVNETAIVDLASERSSLIGLFNGADSGRALIIRQVAEHYAIVKAEHDRAFVLMQYFGYLRLDPNEQTLNSKLAELESKSRNDQHRYESVTCAFVNSADYQNRFGMVPTHNPLECGGR